MNKKYQLLHELLLTNEMSIKKVLTKGSKKLVKNALKDPVAASLILAPIPGSNPTGIGYHLATNKGSRNILQTMGAKIFNSSRAKDTARHIKNVERANKHKLMKFLGVSGTVTS